MCGRYYRQSDKQRIAEQYQARKVFEDPLAADYNIAPTTFQPVIRLGRDTGEREMQLLRWGLVPFFASNLKEFKGVMTSNARVESVATSATWREPLRRRRCLIPADGFYEWASKGGEVRSGASRLKTAARGSKQPYAISLTGGEPLAFAGLWDAWKEPKKSPQEVDRWLQSFAIMTVPANELLAPITERMPVILKPQDWDEWLARDESQDPPMHLLQPYDANRMKAAPCNTLVGNVRNNGPEMLVANKHDEELSGLNELLGV
jgi:putative SOS response-associated peptidase YedK